MLEIYRQNSPGAVSHCERMLEKARAVRAAIPDTPENFQIGYVTNSLCLPVAVNAAGIVRTGTI